MELPPATALPSQTPRRHQFPDVLITDILLRLPFSPCTARFRCLNKSWCRFLSDPSFLSKNLSSSPSNYQILVERIERTERDKSRRVHSFHSSETMELLLPCPPRLPFNPDKIRARRPALRVVGCCNGLLCILQQETDLILWNPATSESKFVPNSPFGRPRDYSVGAIGFGFDPETNDYKIVRPLHENVMCCLQCRYFLEVYSLRADSWNKYDDFPDLGSKMPQCRQGKLYWWKLTSGKKGLVFDSFDIRGEVFDKVELPCPPASNKYGTPACLLKEESMLAVFPDEDEDSDDDGFGGGRKNWSAATWEIWVLLKYWLPESWTKLYVVTSPLMTTLVDCAGISSNLRFFFVGFPSDLVNENGNYWGDRSLLTLEIATGEFTRSHIEAICFEVVTDYVPSRVSLPSYSSARSRHK